MVERAVGRHLVCAFEEAGEILGEQGRCWSPADGALGEERLCLHFVPPGVAAAELAEDQARAALARARQLRRVARLVVDEEGVASALCLGTAGCSCLEKAAEPEAGRLIERTHFEFCTGCGDCVPVCEFGARAVKDGDLVVTRDRCFGCGLCVEVCPELCVTLVARTG